jgi:hypothetical protein
MNFLKRAFGRLEPDCHVPADPVQVFDEAKQLAGDGATRQVVLIRPDLSSLTLACPDAAAMPSAVIEQVESIISSRVKRNIAVVTDTSIAPDGHHAAVGSPSWAGVGRNLPFFGLLNGLGCIGHVVWVFDVSADLTVACREADILIIDSAVAARVTDLSRQAVREVMRTASIFIHDRETFRLQPLPATNSAVTVNPEVLFDEVRARAAKPDARRQIVLVRADRSLLLMPCIPREAMTKDQLAQARRIIPEGTPRSIAVIASTNLVADASDAQQPPAVAQLHAAGRAIPFFGLILNLASAGNRVWIFDSEREWLVPGCRHADLLFIDSDRAGKIPERALDDAAEAMQSANIAVYNRSTRKMALLRSLSGSMDKLIFRDQ